MLTRSQGKHTNSQDVVLKHLLGVTDPGPAVGIELELEFPSGTIPDLIQNEWWQTKPEGSLRNGVEYVSRTPTVLSRIPEALDALYGSLSKNAKTSIRCSTHVHVNCLPLSFKEIFGAITLYYLVEDLLVDRHGENRKGNLFCLRMSDAENVGEDLLEAIQTTQRTGMAINYIRNFNQDRHKYAALNLYMLKHLGTMEFRFMDAFKDKENMARWVDILVRLVYEGSKYTAGDHLRLYDEMDTTAYLQKMFGEHTPYLIAGRSKTEINTILHRNYDFVFDLARALSTIRYFQLPEHLWDADFVEDEGPLDNALVLERPYAPVPEHFQYEELDELEENEIPQLHRNSRGSSLILMDMPVSGEWGQARAICESCRSNWPFLYWYIAQDSGFFFVVCHEITSWDHIMAVSGDKLYVPWVTRNQAADIGQVHIFDLTRAETKEQSSVLASEHLDPSVVYTMVYDCEEDVFAYVQKSRLNATRPSLAAMNAAVESWPMPGGPAPSIQPTWSTLTSTVPSIPIFWNDTPTDTNTEDSF